MTSRYPIEALLRPPVEFVSVAVASTAAWLAWSAPALWMTTAAVGRGAAVGLLCIAAVRLRQGLRVVRFQRNLRRLPDYRLRPAQIPVSTIRLFLGTGFRWTQLHTRRLADTRQPEARPLCRARPVVSLGQEYGNSLRAPPPALSFDHGDG